MKLLKLYPAGFQFFFFFSNFFEIRKMLKKKIIINNLKISGPSLYKLQSPCFPDFPFTKLLASDGEQESGFISASNGNQALPN